MAALLVSTAGGTLTGPLFAPAGTAAAPSFAFSGDPNTGVFSNAANNISLSTDGLARVRVFANGLSVPEGFVQLPAVSGAPSGAACGSAASAGRVVVFRNGAGAAQLYICDDVTATANPGWVVK
jgi:hypothetical protein